MVDSNVAEHFHLQSLPPWVDQVHQEHLTEVNGEILRILKLNGRGYSFLKSSQENNRFFFSFFTMDKGLTH
jgi:hypothetical protein